MPPTAAILNNDSPTLTERTFTLPKEERLKSRTLIDTLFDGGKSRAMTAFPLRMVYMVKDRIDLEPQTQVLVSVPKRCFKRAVKRNRVKRQVRDAYRHHKLTVVDALKAHEHFDRTVVMAFIWLDDKLHPSADVEAKVSGLLTRLSEKI